MDTQHANNTQNKVGEEEEEEEETRIQTNHRENTKDEEEEGVTRDGEEERKGTEEHTNAGEEEEEEESIAEEEEEGEWHEEEIENTETPSPTIHWGTIFSYKNQTGEEPAGDVNHLKGHEAEQQDEEEDGGMCCPEKLLGETIDRLKVGMLLQTDRCKDRQTG